jgi:hypothetical protein
MSVALRLDTREFNRAMQEYIAATGKDSAEAINRQSKNFAIKCLGTVKKSKGAAAIRALKDEPWWPKMVASIMVKQAGSLAGSKIMQAQWAAAKRSAGIKAGKHKNAFKLDREEQSYAKEARRISAAILKSRAGAISFLRFFFRAMAAKMTQYSKGGSIPSGKAFSGFQSQVTPATPGKLSVVMSTSYGFKRRGAGSAASAEVELQKAMTAALPVTVADMRTYTAKQLAKRARQYSGRK